MLLFDVEHKRWSKEMMEICGVKESQLAEIFESYETVGTLKPELAAELGLSENVKIAAGAGDNAAAAVGFPWEPREPFSSPARNSAWMSTTPSTPSPTRTGTTI